MQTIAVPLVAFVFLVGSVAAGVTGQARLMWSPVLPGAAGLLRGLAVAMVGLALAALAVVTYNTRGEFREAEAELALFAGDVAALDGALRAAGEGAAPARMALFRFTEAMSRTLYADRHGAAPAGSEPLEAMRAALGQAVAALPPEAALAVGRFETVTRSAAGLLAAVPLPGVKMCRPIIVGWMMGGLGLLALLAGPRARSSIWLVAMAGMLALAVFYLEEIASPFTGSIVVSSASLDDVLHAICE